MACLPLLTAKTHRCGVLREDSVAGRDRGRVWRGGEGREGGKRGKTERAGALSEQETICLEAHPNLSELTALNWFALPLLPGNREASWLIHGE